HKQNNSTLNKSVVSREFKRNRNKHETYSYSHAQMLADVHKSVFARTALYRRNKEPHQSLYATASMTFGTDTRLL
ncbi:UNVERIFIED_CONTAM: hypothetical protein NY603_30270, partial [Bacteroidetes bacterium 56_B9]